jgi:hypothetical protein
MGNLFLLSRHGRAQTFVVRRLRAARSHVIARRASAAAASFVPLSPVLFPKSGNATVHFHFCRSMAFKRETLRFDIHVEDTRENGGRFGKIHNTAPAARARNVRLGLWRYQPALMMVEFRE